MINSTLALRSAILRAVQNYHDDVSEEFNNDFMAKHFRKENPPQDVNKIVDNMMYTVLSAIEHDIHTFIKIGSSDQASKPSRSILGTLLDRE